MSLTRLFGITQISAEDHEKEVQLKRALDTAVSAERKKVQEMNDDMKKVMLLVIFLPFPHGNIETVKRTYWFFVVVTYLLAHAGCTECEAERARGCSRG